MLSRTSLGHLVVACANTLLLVFFSSPILVDLVIMERLKSAADQTKVTVKLPAKWLGQYGDFITKNAGAVGQVEGALRSLTYIIPGKL